VVHLELELGFGWPHVCDEHDSFWLFGSLASNPPVLLQCALVLSILALVVQCSCPRTWITRAIGPPPKEMTPRPRTGRRPSALEYVRPARWAVRRLQWPMGARDRAALDRRDH